MAREIIEKSRKESTFHNALQIDNERSGAARLGRRIAERSERNRERET